MRHRSAILKSENSEDVKHLKQPEKLLVATKRLRKNMSLPEVLLWKCLKKSNHSEVVIKRQVPLLGKYVVDFYFQPLQIVFEIDGKHIHSHKVEDDKARHDELCANGYKVVRIDAQSVLKDSSHVASYIQAICKEEIDPEV